MVVLNCDIPKSKHTGCSGGDNTTVLYRLLKPILLEISSHRYSRVSMTAPRGEAARQRIVTATRELVYEGGFDAFNVEAVASACGAARSTIYRHWPEPKELLIDALRSMGQHIPTPDEGSLAADLEAMAFRVRPLFDDPRTRRLILDLTRAAAEDPAIERARQQLIRDRQGPTQTILQRAIARGEVDPELDLDIAIHLVEGPLMSASVLQNQPMSDIAVKTMVARIVKSLS
jgi:AcrR family transcriptional regulator